MDWSKDISDSTKEWMVELGNFSPTVNVREKLVKGYMIDGSGDAGRVYFDPSDLRGLAAACLEVADWLENRAKNDLR